VILAILAAIAIPALTGYIEKARMQDFKSEARTALVALQALTDEQYARDGEFKLYSYDSDFPNGDEIWDSVSDYNSIGYFCDYLTEYGKSEFKKLTGVSYAGNIFVHLCIDKSGSPKYMEYTKEEYFGESRDLVVFYLSDDTSPVTQELKDSFNNITPWLNNITPGFNVFECNTEHDFTYTKLG
jgi:hypothetical protein